MAAVADGDGGGSVVRVEKEMGLTHQDFFRVLPRVLGDTPHTQTPTRITVEQPPRRLEIELGEESERRIGPTIRLPVTRVTLLFENYSDAQRISFLTAFDDQYRRGGG